MFYEWKRLPVTVPAPAHTHFVSTEVSTWIHFEPHDEHSVRGSGKTLWADQFTFAAQCEMWKVTHVPLAKYVPNINKFSIHQFSRISFFIQKCAHVKPIIIIITIETRS